MLTSVCASWRARLLIQSASRQIRTFTFSSSTFDNLPGRPEPVPVEDSTIVWSPLQRPRKEIRVGVCVSGGADSMALAFLLHRAFIRGVTQAGGSHFKLTALIVDHGVRDISRKEAETVAKHLQDISIPSLILPLDLKSGDNHSPMQGTKNIEGMLRELRYRALVEEAIKQKIQYLVTGHHLDDQIETILVRLIRDDTLNPLSFQGIFAEALVPCNQDVLGAHFTASNLATILENQSPKNNPAGKMPWKMPPPRGFQARTSDRAEGIKIIRPLLGHRKQELITFCRKFNIPFVNDETNFDPTVTARNALRHIRSHNTLPAALMEENLVQLRKGALDMRAKIINNAKNLGRRSAAQVYEGDGSVEITLPRIADLSVLATRHAIAYLLARIAELISPVNETQIPELLTQEDLMLENLDQEETTTRLKLQIVRTKLNHSHRLTYRLYRQRMNNPDRQKQNRSFTWPSAPNDGPSDFECWSQALKTEWLYWDNRFWIRLATTRTRFVNKISIRPLHDGKDVDLMRLLRQKCHAIVAATRETVPALFLDDKVVALPTYNLWLNESLKPYLRWEVRYNIPSRTAELLLPKSDPWVRDPYSAEISTSVQEILRSSLDQENPF